MPNADMQVIFENKSPLTPKELHEQKRMMIAAGVLAQVVGDYDNFRDAADFSVRAADALLKRLEQ